MNYSHHWLVTSGCLRCRGIRIHPVLSTPFSVNSSSSLLGLQPQHHQPCRKFLPPQRHGSSSTNYPNWKFRKNAERAFMDSSLVVDYKAEEKVGPWWNPFSKEGRQAFFYNLKLYALHLIHSIRLKREINYNRKLFLKDAETSYKKVYELSMKGDLDALKPFVTQSVLSKLKKRMQMKDLTIHWELKKMIERPKIIRLIYMNDSDMAIPFILAQIFVQFHSLQVC
ncbi:hypothetical protein HMI55_001318 [Coelomomyces lativittatus]|nr:hypothetical protein HMI55_001318 [Coelomomyces lativittatus]